MMLSFPFLKKPLPAAEPTPSAQFAAGITTIQDILAPDAIEVDFSHLKIGSKIIRTLFVAGYPRFVTANWLSPLINFDHSLDVSMFIYPVEGKGVLDDLRRKITEMEAEINSDIQRGRIPNIETQIKLEDAKALQEQLAKGAERFYQFGLYITLTADNLEELDHLTKQIQSTLGALLIIAKPATLQMEPGFKTTQPLGQDYLNVTRNMDTTSLATTFPFTSSELTANEGIMYGINEHNDSLVIFDRFTMENANMVVFAKSGGGKSTHRSSNFIVRNGNKVTMEKIGPYIDKLMSKHPTTKIDAEIEGVVNPNIDVLTFDQSLNVSWSPVTVAARKDFNKRRKLYKIATKSGREIIVTADHNLVILRNGKVRVMRSEAVKIGERIPLPRYVSEQDSFPSFITLKDFVPMWPTNLPKTLPLGKEFLMILGLITSEGYADHETVQIYNTDPQVLNIIRNSVTKLGFRISPRYNYPLRSIRGFSIQPGNSFAKFISGLGAGGRSGKKRVPPIIFSLSNEQIAHYLRSYYEGDGGVESHEVTATTKSKNLASDLSYILLRFGIIARIHPKQKAAVNTKNQTKNTYYQITISSKDQIQKFADKIGFLTEVKNQKLALLLKKISANNTNVDTIPGLQSVFKHLYNSLYPTTEIKAPQVIIDIKNGIYSPSREQVLHAIALCENRLQQLQSLAPYINLLRELPSISRLIRLGSRNKLFNRILWEKLGQTWRNIKQSLRPPLTQNALLVYQTVSGKTLTAPLLASAVYTAFKQQGESLQQYNKSLWSAVVLKKSKNPQYRTLFKAAKFIARKYRSTQLKIRHAQEKLAQLKLLANSDLYWDPIAKIEKIKHREEYVYDLQVDNGVFLAGHGGMFVHNSYLVKLESLRSLMFDAEVIVIDPEDEYRRMCEAVNGQYIEFSFNAAAKINPFDLPNITPSSSSSPDSQPTTQNLSPDNELSQKLLSLHSLMKIMLGDMDATQEAILDRALVACYKAKGITPDPTTQNNEPPLLEDLYKAFIGMEEPQAANLAARLEKFVKGSFRGLFDQRTNVDIKNEFVVFGIKNLEDALRPIAMFMILDFIWTRIKSSLKRRLLVVDEAWYLMKNRDSATFLYSIAKRARKYYLGLTTITQDVEDFLSSDYGKAIVTNSSLQILMKQSAAAVDKLGEVFYLSEGEKQLLLSAEVGEGLFFAGQNHVAIKVLASDDEHKLITSKPQELLEMKKSQNPQNSPIPPSSPIPPTPAPPPTLTPAPQPITHNPQPAITTQPIQPITNPAPPSPLSPLPTTHNPQPTTPSSPSVEFTSIFENPPKKSA